MFALLTPTLQTALIGDDYEWIQYTRRVLDRPELFFSRTGGYFRPSTTLVFLIDRALWGINPFGYRLDNLLLHSANGILLFLAAVRLRLHAVTALCVALLWVTSPYSIEIAIQPAMRADALLALGWVGLVGIWPRSGEHWSRLRIAVAGVSTAMAICSKETWVVTPAIALVLERYHHGSSWRRSFRVVAPNTRSPPWRRFRTFAPFSCKSRSWCLSDFRSDGRGLPQLWGSFWAGGMPFGAVLPQVFWA